MATSRRIFLIGACFSSAIALILALTALGTEYWVVSEAAYIGGELDKNQIHYGLFKGIEDMKYPSDASNEILMTCLFSENVCAVLCGEDSESRKAELEHFYNDPNYNSSSKDHCISVKRGVTLYNQPWRSGETGERRYINAGVYVSTLFFLCLAVLFGVAATALSFWNVIDNPVQIIFSTLGIYIANAVALASTILYIMLWGIHYATTLSKGIAIQDTLSHTVSTDGRANLGYSYWINLVSMFLYAISLGLLYTRTHLIRNDPIIQKEIELENTDNPTIFLF